MTKRETEEQKFDIFRAICEDIASGLSIKQACENQDKNKCWYFRYLADNINDDKIRNLSAHAREMKAHSYFDKCEEALLELERGEREYTTAKVLFDSYLRLATKANQATFGDKIQQELSGAVTLMPSVEINGVPLDFDIGERVDN
jgi:hypothetical protein